MMKGIRTALVTGGARRIGGSITRHFVKAGYAVALHYYSAKEEAKALIESVKNESPEAEIQAFRADLTNREEINRLFNDVLNSHLPPVAVLVNNASIFERDEWDSVTEELWDRHMRSNLEAPYWLSRAMAKALQKKNEHGVIINIIDQRVFNLTPHFMSYSLSKAGLLALTNIMARALAPAIRVNAVAPGPTLPSERQNSQIFANLCESMPLKRAVVPSDIVAAIDFIVKTKSLTGQTIAIDSGQHMGWKHLGNNSIKE